MGDAIIGLGGGAFPLEAEIDLSAEQLAAVCELGEGLEPPASDDELSHVMLALCSEPAQAIVESSRKNSGYDGDFRFAETRALITTRELAKVAFKLLRHDENQGTERKK